jgi:site-specific DNA recombinase
VRPARGRLWNSSTINGNVSRGGGILLNDLYAGRIVWNKVRMVKDPMTGKRLSRPNPKDQYRIAEAPHLRIVDDATFKAARARKVERRHDATPETGQKARAPKRVFFRADHVRLMRRRHGVNRRRSQRACAYNAPAHRESGSAAMAAASISTISSRS